MGGGNVKSPILKKSELIDFHNISYFPNDTIMNLYNKFTGLSAINKDDGVIDYEEFCIMTGKESNDLTEKIFNCIDYNHDGRINFREFLKFISCFISGTVEDQKMLSFKIFSDEESNLIHKSFMFNTLKKILVLEGGNTFSDYFDEETLNFIVDESFPKQTGEFLSFEDYSVIVDKNPFLLSWFKIDINKLKENSVMKNKGCFGFG
jgi:Ca2+-binding EF-hand superfamily protein